jgi:SulP family sulfate permease
VPPATPPPDAELRYGQNGPSRSAPDLIERSSRRGPAPAAGAVPVTRSLVAGLVAGIWAVAGTLAYAGLIFTGEVAAALPLGVSALLAALAIQSIVIGAASRSPGIATAAIGGSALIYVAAVQALDAHLAARGVPEGAVRGGAAVIACGLITLATGVALSVFGWLRVGSLVRLLPHPVSAGYFCGLGAAFVLGALGMAVGAPPGPATILDADAMTRVAACVALAVLLLVLPQRTRHWSVIPTILLGSTLLFHAARLALGQDLAAAQASGWLLGPFQQGQVLLPPAASFALFDVGVLLTLAPFIVSVILLSAITVAFMVTGLEGLMNRTMDLDREMALAGAASVAAGGVGGIVGAQALGPTTMLAQLGACSRLAASVTPALAIGLILAGPAALGLVPKPVLAALLLAFGIEQMVLRTWRESRRLPRHEVAILLSVGATMASIGIVEGLGAGLAVALLIFVWTYRKVPVIRSVLRGDEMRSSVLRPHAALLVLRNEGSRILLIRLQGYIFFLNAQSVQAAFIQGVEGGARIVILDFAHVSGMDSSAIYVFRRIEQQAWQDNVHLVLSAMTEPLRDNLARHGVMAGYHLARVASADRAIEHAEEIVLASHAPAWQAAPKTLAQYLLEFGGLTATERRLTPFVTRVDYAPGDALMRQGEAAEDMIFVEEGSTVATLQDTLRGSVHLRTMRAGSFVGEVALMRGGARTASVIAETACVGQRITREALSRMETEDPVLCLALQRAILVQLADRLADNARAVELAFR